MCPSFDACNCHFDFLLESESQSVWFGSATGKHGEIKMLWWTWTGARHYKWMPQCQEAFHLLKDKLIHYPVLVHPNVAKEFILETDANFSELGAHCHNNKMIYQSIQLLMHP